MYLKRSLAMLILIALFVTIGTAFAEQTGNHITGSYVMGINKFYYGYAWAKNTDNDHAGWYHVWAHVGDGDNDYSGGSYTGAFEDYAFSLHITTLDDPNQPQPYWASHFIN